MSVNSIERSPEHNRALIELHELRGQLRITQNALALAIELLEKGEFEAYQITLLKLALRQENTDD